MTKIRKALLAVYKQTYDFLAKTPLRKVKSAWEVSNFFFRFIWPGENIIYVQGSKMFIDVNEPNPNMRKTFQAYGLNLIHEEATTALFKKVVKEGDIIIDVGANIGYFSLLAARISGQKGKVYSFEPEPTNFKYLSKNIQINNYIQVSTYQKAVSNKEGQVKLFICPYDSGHHTINQSQGIKSYRHGCSGEITEIEIDAVALDNFLAKESERVDLVKIDAEGAEMLVIEGMKNILIRNKRIKVFLEFFPLLITGMESSPERLINFLLNELSFNIFIIGHDYSMDKQSNLEYIKITSYAEIARFVKHEEEHLNLYLTREDILA